MMQDTQPPLLHVSSLAVDFATRRGVVHAVRDISFDVPKGRTLGIVGESGSGKSVTSYAVMRILDRAGRIAGGEIVFGGVSLTGADESEMEDIRGREISMIFQNPRAALNPIRSVGRQIEDVLIRHAQATHETARDRAIDALRKVRIHDPEARYHSYPFELSGGMCQRVVIAIALACRPQLLIADEPTTGLDVTTQRTVMELIRDLTRSEGMASILITHDLGLAGEYCDDIIVMEKGEVVERQPAEKLFTDPAHPYTQRLIMATPHAAGHVRELLPVANRPDPTHHSERHRGAADAGAPLLRVSHLVKSFQVRDKAAVGWSRFLGRTPQREFRAVDDISFDVHAGESVGLVGESGCGKSTTSSIVMRLMAPTSGNVWFDGQELSRIPLRDFSRHPCRKDLQMVFQDPTDSLNPRWTAAASIADPLRALMGMRDRVAIRERVEELAAQVGLEAALLDRLPHQLSGGQKARVGIARAIATSPRLLVLDEPTAALDVSVQAVVLNLLVDLRDRYGMSYLFVSHDLEVVRLLCDRVIVMRTGRIVEEGPTQQVLGQPRDSYTRELLAAIPRPRFMRSHHRSIQDAS